MTPQPEPLSIAAARFDASFRVRFDEAGADGLARPSTLLRFAQDAAWQHGTSLGLDRAWYEEHQLVWVVRAVSLEILAPIPVGAVLRISTAVIGHRRIWARRRVEMRLDQPQHAAVGRPADQPVAAVALTDWVLTDLAGRIQRLEASFADIFGVPPATFEITRVILGPVPGGAARSTLTVRPQEVDPNGHLNNAVHLDWVDEVVTVAASGPATERLPRRYEVEYLAPLAPGARVALAAWRADSRGDPDWLVAMAREGGAAAARARLVLG